jgi:tryptophan-rich sensory protein
MNETFLGLPWIVWTVLCLIVAIINTLIWPHPNEHGPERPPWRKFILRWAHGLVWVYLALSCLLRATKLVDAGIADFVALLGLLTYIIFIMALISERKANQHAEGQSR